MPARFALLLAFLQPLNPWVTSVTLALRALKGETWEISSLYRKKRGVPPAANESSSGSMRSTGSSWSCPDRGPPQAERAGAAHPAEPAAVTERLRRLESSGAITGTGAGRSEALGYGIQAFIRVNPHAAYTLKHPRTLELMERTEITEVQPRGREDCWIVKVAVPTPCIWRDLEQVSALGGRPTSIVGCRRRWGRSRCCRGTARSAEAKEIPRTN